MAYIPLTVSHFEPAIQFKPTIQVLRTLVVFWKDIIMIDLKDQSQRVVQSYC